MSEEQNKPERVTPEKIPTSQELVRVPQSFLPGSMTDALALSRHDGGLEGFNVRELWRKVRKRKWLILAVVVIAGTLISIEAFRTKSIFQANTTVAVARDASTYLRTDKVVVQGDDTDKIKTEMLFLKTYPLLEEVVARLKLDERPEFLEVESKGSLAESLTSIGTKFRRPLEGKFNAPIVNPIQLGPESPVPLTPEESARLEPYVTAVNKYLLVDQIPETRALLISYTHSDPLIAAAVANGAAQVLIDRSFQHKTESFKSSAGWLDENTRKLQTQVRQAEQELADYTRVNNIISTDGKETLLTDKLGKLHGEALKAETDRIIKQSLYEQVKQGNVARLPDAFADPRAGALQAKLGEYQVQAAQLGVKFGPENPKLAEVNQQIAELEKLLAESKRKLEEKLKADYERAARDEGSLKLSLDKAKAEAVRQNQAAIQLSILRQQVETTKTLYNDFLTKTSQANIQLAEQGRDLRIIEPARIPLTPIGPKRLRTIAIGLFLSLVGGIGLALLLEYLDNTVKSVEDVTRVTQLPTLAMIPAVGTNTLSLLGSRRKAVAAELSDAGATDIPAEIAALAPRGLQPLGEDLATLDGLSSVAEAYRMLRTSVLLSSAGNPPKTILITSSQPGEGKTTTAVNTAISLANLGVSVLLVDCDLRRPAVHKQFKLAHARGLTTYLSSDVPLASVIQKPPVEHLSVMVCGPVPPNPAELISSERMKTLLRQLAAQYDHIILDSPPLMNVTDPVILSTMADGVLLIVQAGRSTRDIVRRACQDLRSVGAKIFGVVLNNVDLKREGYYDYFYHRYYSGYGDEKKAARGRKG